MVVRAVVMLVYLNNQPTWIQLLFSLKILPILPHFYCLQKILCEKEGEGEGKGRGEREPKRSIAS